MIHALLNAARSEFCVQEVRPSRPPLFRFVSAVPVRSLNGPAFIGALFLVINLVSSGIEDVFFPLLFVP
jgi:hypothetical protein